MKGYVLDYINENEFKKLERALKKYNMLAFKKLTFDYYPALRNGEFVGELVSTNKKEETAKYDGNIGLAAHNRGNEYSYFARINELVPGDEIIYQTKFGERKYIVNTLTEILETDWSLLEQDQTNKLTLITCIKNKVNQRLCVQAVEKEI